MGSHTKVYDKFQGYSLSDCACDACLYYPGKGSKPCLRAVCCCAEEKAEALMREMAAENQWAAASVRGAVYAVG